MIIVKNLTKKYENLIAIDGISFIVEKGEVFGLLGPNGAGKTTTVEILECLRKQTSGESFIDGLIVHKKTYLEINELNFINMLKIILTRFLYFYK